MTQEIRSIGPENKAQGFVLKIKKTPERSDDPEIQAALDWYHERLKMLPELRVTDSVIAYPEPITKEEEEAMDPEKKKWLYKLGPEKELLEIRGAHFKIGGLRANASTYSWEQPYFEQAYQNTKDTEGNDIKVSGLIVVAKDPKGRVLLAVTNEPKVNEKIIDGIEKHPALRSPIQTSITKLEQLEAGQEQFDPILFVILNDLANGQNLRAVTRELEWSPVDTDGNRSRTYVWYSELSVSADRVKDLEAKTGGMFLSKRQRAALRSEINGHTHVALDLHS